MWRLHTIRCQSSNAIGGGPGPPTRQLARVLCWPQLTPWHSWQKLGVRARYPGLPPGYLASTSTSFLPERLGLVSYALHQQYLPSSVVFNM